MATNKKPLYIPWNDEEFNSDPRVRGMNHFQRWMYRSLLQACFWATERPNLPNDDEQLWVLAGCESLEEWLQHKDKVLRRFTVVESEGISVLQNKRVVADWERLMDVRGRMAEMGQKSAAARNPSTLDPIPRTLNDGLTTVKPTLNVGCTPALLTANVPVTCVGQDKISEGNISEAKRSESKRSEETAKENNGVVDSVSGLLSAGAIAPDPPPNLPSVNWKDLAIPYRKIFGKQASTKFKARYFDACTQYGSIAVSECFEKWAPSAHAWAERENVEHPLHAFFKQLSTLILDVVETKAAEDDFQAAEASAVETDAARAAIIEANAQRQEKAQQDFMRKAPATSNKTATITAEGKAEEYL